MNYVQLTGTENLKRIFKDFPENGYKKPVLSAFRKAAVPVKDSMANNLPANLKSIKRILKIKAYKGKSPLLAVGFFAGQGVYRNRRGQTWDPWQILYWHNYGTMDWRTTLARLHVFKTPRKLKTANKNGGIKPGFFIEKAWEQSKNEAQRTFEENVEKEIDKFFKDRAAK